MPRDSNSPTGADAGSVVDVRVHGTPALQVTVSWKHVLVILGGIATAVWAAYLWADGRFDGLSDAISMVADRVTYMEGLLEARPEQADQ